MAAQLAKRYAKPVPPAEYRAEDRQTYARGEGAVSMGENLEITDPSRSPLLLFCSRRCLGMDDACMRLLPSQAPFRCGPSKHDRPSVVSDELDGADPAFIVQLRGEAPGGRLSGRPVSPPAFVSCVAVEHACSLCATVVRRSRRPRATVADVPGSASGPLGPGMPHGIA